ncbi:MAG: DciA family protein [Thermodesulfobacteriota bacterium]
MNRPPGKITAIATLLGNLSLEKKWRERLGMHALFLFWNEVVGEEIATRAQPTIIRGTVLWVEVSDPVWLQQLHLERGTLLAGINRRLPGETKLSDIRFQLNSLLDQEPPTVPPEEPPPQPQPLSREEAHELDSLLATLADDEARATMRRLWLKAHGRM